MRIRTAVATATAAALSAALAVAALAVPAAGATRAAGTTGTARTAQDDSASTFWNIDVNHDRDYTVGVTAAQKRVFSVSATISDPSGVKSASFELWHGDESRAKVDGLITGSAQCHRINALTSYCEALLTADPNVNLRSNSLAGLWYMAPVAVDGDGNVTRGEGAYFARIKRSTYPSQTDATPEPVKKGQNLSVKARMTVASWAQHKNVPLIGHQVLLQYRKGTSGPFVTLKKLKTDSNGWARATVKATADGAYRYEFAGTSLTLPTSGYTDYVDVK